MEAIEDPVTVRRSNTRPVVPHGHAALIDDHLDRRAGRGELVGVAEQVADRSLEQAGVALDHARVGVHRDRPIGAAPETIDRSLGDTAQLQPNEGFGVLVVGGQLDQLAEQLVELAQLGLDRRQHGGAVLGIQPVGALEEGDVGPQARQRRAQLVARVVHETVLLLAAGGQRIEHLLETAREGADLVGAVDLDRGRQVVGVGDGGGRRREAPQRAGGLSGDEEPHGRSERRHHEADQDHPVAERVQDAGGLLDRPCDLHGTAAGNGHRVEAVVDPVDRDVAEQVLLVGVAVVFAVERLGDHHIALAHRQGDLGLRGRDLAVGVEGLHDRIGVERKVQLDAIGPRGLPPPAISGWLAAAFDDVGRASLEELVGLGGQFGVGGPEDEKRHDGDAGCGEQTEEQCQSGAKAHGSIGRMAYPMPRLVWITRSAPPSSSLRRRYPTWTSSDFDEVSKS